MQMLDAHGEEKWTERRDRIDSPKDFSGVANRLRCSNRHIDAQLLVTTQGSDTEAGTQSTVVG